MPHELHWKSENMRRASAMYEIKESKQKFSYCPVCLASFVSDQVYKDHYKRQHAKVRVK